DPGGGLDREWTVYERHMRTATPRRGGDGHAHPAAGLVGDVSHRIDRFARGPRCDEHAEAIPGRWLKRATDRREQRLGLGQSPRANALTGGKIADHRIDHGVAQLTTSRHVRLHG